MSYFLRSVLYEDYFLTKTSNKTVDNLDERITEIFDDSVTWEGV